MKITVRRTGERMSIYVAKKDLELFVLETEKPEMWGGWIRVSNDWRLELPPLAADTRLPITVEARKLSED